MLGPCFQGFPASSIVSAALSRPGVLAPGAPAHGGRPALSSFRDFPPPPPPPFFFFSSNTSHEKVPVLLTLFISLTPFHGLSEEETFLAFTWVQVTHTDAWAENRAFLLSENLYLGLLRASAVTCLQYQLVVYGRWIQVPTPQCSLKRSLLWADQDFWLVSILV